MCTFSSAVPVVVAGVRPCRLLHDVGSRCHSELGVFQQSVSSGSSDRSPPRFSHGDCAAGQRGGRGECLIRLEGDGSTLVLAAKVMFDALAAPGVARWRLRFCARPGNFPP